MVGSFSILVLENAANAAAQYCLKYNIPVKHLTNAELKSGQKGIVSHAQVSEVFKKSDHTDPGKGFPWDHFIDRVQHHHTERLKRFNVVV
jgi:N-acetyl-anhydromuramyl-L-alanine amidase AmpD